MAGCLTLLTQQSCKKISKREGGRRHRERDRERQRQRQRDLMNRNQGESDSGYNFFLIEYCCCLSPCSSMVFYADEQLPGQVFTDDASVCCYCTCALFTKQIFITLYLPCLLEIIVIRFIIEYSSLRGFGP
jgi:hypothetical protein